jgi:hypothetical protein
VLEISASLSDLFGSNNCPSTIPTVFYFDGADTAPDDNTPDNGTITTNCGSPTIINLANMDATSNTSTLLIVGAALLLLASGGAALAYKRYRA